MLPHQQTKQFGDGHGGMGIVQLDCIAIPKARKVLPIFFRIPANKRLHGGAGEKVLLFEPQPFACVGIVIGIEHGGNFLRPVLPANRLIIFLAVKGIKVKRLHRLGLPQAQGIDRSIPIADHRHIIRHRPDRLICEMDQDRLFFSAHAPWIAKAHPVVRFLLLKAVFEPLAKQAVTVANAKSVQRQTMGGGRVQKAGGQPPQTAVAQSVILDLLKNRRIEALFL